jgi:hypothetical protein
MAVHTEVLCRFAVLISVYGNHSRTTRRDKASDLYLSTLHRIQCISQQPVQPSTIITQPQCGEQNGRTSKMPATHVYFKNQWREYTTAVFDTFDAVMHIECLSSYGLRYTENGPLLWSRTGKFMVRLYTDTNGRKCCLRPTDSFL